MGVKSHGEEGGVDVVTHEVINGKKVKITDSFRAYDTPEDSIRGYGKFLKANSRYRHFLRAGAENEDAHCQPCKLMAMRLTRCTRRSSRTL